MTEMLVVSDGPTFWEYMPLLKQYTRKHSEPTTVTSRGIDNVDRTSDKAEHARIWALALGVAIPRLDNIAESLKEARLLREEAVEIDGASITCDVIEAVYDSSSGRNERPMLQKTFWIDKSRYLVVREARTTGFGKVASDHLRLPLIVTTFSAVKLNEPLADDLFVFIPPGDASEIKDFNGPSSAGKSR